MERLPNEEMAALWNGASGQAWVDEQSLLDQTYEAIEKLLADAVAASGARSVLDIGCGAGATTLAVARTLGARGNVVGIDISDPLIAVARARAQREGLAANFIRADAQTHDFAPASFDMMISRFGVMFFEDPVAAFANLRRASTTSGALRLVVFRSVAENPFMTTAERAAGPSLPNVPPRKPGAPGQFAFADRDRVRSILEDSGWSGIELAPVDVECAFPATSLERFFTRLGPVGQALRDADEGLRQQVSQRISAAFQPFVHGDEVRFIAACWMVSAGAAS
jgi:SAM-dependent methyltransferase